MFAVQQNQTKNAAFNQSIALETEEKLLDSATIGNDVKRLFNTHQFYVVAERPGESDTTTVAGWLMIACFGGYNTFVLTRANNSLAYTIP